MNKIVILGLLIGFSLSMKPSKEDSPCVLKEPDGPEECFNEATEYFEQTCCFFIGTYKNVNNETVHGKGCLEALRIDVSTGEKKAITQKKIENGTYWENYEGIQNMESFLCYSPISECEKIQPAKNEEECYNAHPELTSEKCCYVESDWVEGDKIETNLKYCADIRIDSYNRYNLEEYNNNVLRKSVKGRATNIKKIKCFSTSLKINLLALALVLFIF